MNKYELSEAYVGGPTGRVEGKRRIYGGGGSKQTTVSSQEIPAELKPLANLYVKQATDIAQTPYQNYGGQRYADLNQTQNAGIGMVQQRALNGSQTMNNAESGLNQFIQGGNTNPYLDSMVSKAQGSVVDQFNNMVKPQTEQAMQNSGSFGNSGYQQLMQNQQKAAGNQMSDIATQMYGQAYGQDQSNKLNAINAAPTFGNAAYQDAGQLLQAGGLQQQNAQNPLDFQYQQFQDAQNNPYKQLQATGGVVGQSAGTSTSSSGGGK